MSTYNKASLILIPSGTKTSKIYSQKPINGDGDFTFSRSTMATRVNESGLIEKETQNLLLQSNSFDTTWNSDDGLTGGQSGYDGSNDAWLFTLATNPAIVRQANTSGGVQTYSVYAKGNTNNGIRLYAFGSSNCYAFFDLNAGTVESNQNLIDATIEDKGNGWYRCAITFNQTNTQLYMYLSNNQNLNASSGSILIQDAQLEQGLAARDYIETTTSAVYGGITDNVPRLDYTDATCPSLLLEPTRTNLMTHSEFTNVLNNVTLSYVESPEGLNNAMRLTETTSNSQHYATIENALVTSGVKYSISFFIKKGTHDQVRLYTQSSTINFSLRFTFSSETLEIFGTDAETGSENFVDYGNGWYRISANGTANSTGTVDIYATTKSLGSYTGSTSDYTDYYGFQIEEGSYPTSYIPTYGTSVTRNADYVDIPQSSYNINNSFSIHLDFGITKKIEGVSTNIYSLITNEDLNFQLYTNSSGNDGLNVYLKNQGGYVFGSNPNDGWGNTASKICVTYNANTGRLAYFINGSLYNEQTSILSFGTHSTAYITPSANNLMEIKKYLFFESALTDQEAINLTTI